MIQIGALGLIVSINMVSNHFKGEHAPVYRSITVLLHWIDDQRRPIAALSVISLTLKNLNMLERIEWESGILIGEQVVRKKVRGPEETGDTTTTKEA